MEGDSGTVWMNELYLEKETLRWALILGMISDTLLSNGGFVTGIKKVGHTNKAVQESTLEKFNQDKSSD